MPSNMQMQSISGIITQIHVTMEEVPPALVGASVNVIDDKVYVFAGRLATSRKMTNYLYILDLNTLCWTRHIPPPDSDSPPKARYFHSASVYKNQLVIFGGMGHSRISSEGLCVLDDVAVLDIDTMCWKKQSIQPSLYSPQARYAHLSSIAEDKLLIVGGQDLDNNYLDEMNVLNLKTWEWEQVKAFEKHVGAYRSIAVTAPPGTRFPSSASMMQQQQQQQHDETTDENPGSNSESHNTASDDVRATSLRQFSTNALQSVGDEASPVYLYTNYNFADVKRELQVIFANNGTGSTTAANASSPPPQPEQASTAIVEDCSHYMNGSVMPPGLRFPTGHTLGNHLILAGTYLSPQTQSYTIWALDLGKLTWSRIETGTVFNTGSWNRGALHARSNRFLVFGNSNRSLLDDYNHRQVNFDHIAMVDLEAFGVYSLPKATCSSLAQEMGLRLLNEPAVSDFHIITQDNQSIPVNSAVLCQRWPYFSNLMKNNHQVVSQSTSKRSSQHVQQPAVVEEEAEEEEEGEQEDTKEEVEIKEQQHSDDEKKEALESSVVSITSAPASNTSSLSLIKDINDTPIDLPSDKEEEENEDRIDTTAEEMAVDQEITLIKSHYMSFPYPHAVVIALLQYIYTDNLLTAQQYQPHILSQLLLLSDMYDIPRLRELSTHALHQMLNMSTAPLIFETAALSHQTSLQIRALKMMIAAKKMIQQQQQLQQQQQQQLQHNNSIRSRTVSTPAVVAASNLMDPPAPISPTASLSSSSYNNNSNATAESLMASPSATRLSNYDTFASNTASPTLQSFRSRKPSLSSNRSTAPSAYSPQQLQQRSSTLGGMYSPSRNTYSPPATPRQQRSHPTSELDLNTSSPRRSSSPPPKPQQPPQAKEKKKKKAFLEAFGKFSSSISFQNNSNNNNSNHT
ncbi:hypothetical protein V8B55DRAFT_1461274 [Mucor lusitanicus]